MFKTKVEVDRKKIIRSKRISELCDLSIRVYGYHINFLETYYRTDPFYEKTPENRADKKEFVNRQREILVGVEGRNQLCANLDPIISKPVESIRHAPKPITIGGGDGQHFNVHRDSGYDQEITHFLVGKEGKLKKLIGENKGEKTKIAFHFYGKTGITSFNLVGLSSYMGTAVLDIETGVLDVGFRGSRSGKVTLERLRNEAAKGEGNADWITDLGIRYLKEEPKICPGHVCDGFSDAYLSCETALAQICLIAKKKCLEKGKELKINITGHSLGGAIANIFGSAMHSGAFAETVARLEIKNENPPHLGDNKKGFSKQEKDRKTKEIWKNICKKSDVVSFDAPPTHGEDAIKFMGSEAKKHFTRVCKKDDKVTEGLTLPIKLALLKTETAQTKTLLSQGKINIEKIMHPGTLFSLGKVSSKWYLPESLSFLLSGQVAHVPWINRVLINEILGKPTTQNELMWIRTNLDMEPTGWGKSSNVLFPEEYAYLATSSINYEDELTFILARYLNEREDINKVGDLILSYRLQKNLDDRLQENLKGTSEIKARTYNSKNNIENIISNLVQLEKVLKNPKSEDEYNSALQKFEKTIQLLAIIQKRHSKESIISDILHLTKIVHGCYSNTTYSFIHSLQIEKDENKLTPLQKVMENLKLALTKAKKFTTDEVKQKTCEDLEKQLREIQANDSDALNKVKKILYKSEGILAINTGWSRHGKTTSFLKAKPFFDNVRNLWEKINNKPLETQSQVIKEKTIEYKNALQELALKKSENQPSRWRKFLQAVKRPSLETAAIVTSTTGGAAIGAIVGMLVGTFAFPGVGTGLGAVLGAAIGAGVGAFTSLGSVGLGRLFSISGVSRFFGATVTTGLSTGVGAGIGAVLGTFVFPGIGTGIGAAIGAGFGLAVGAGISGVAQVIKSQSNLGKILSLGLTGSATTAIGAGIGAILGTVIPIPGVATLTGILIGAGIGASVGALTTAIPVLTAYLMSGALRAIAQNKENLERKKLETQVIESSPYKNPHLVSPSRNSLKVEETSQKIEEKGFRDKNDLKVEEYDLKDMEKDSEINSYTP